MKKIQKWLHDWLGWGYPWPGGGTLPLTEYQCRFCDKIVRIDSQGNWFHLT